MQLLVLPEVGDAGLYGDVGELGGPLDGDVLVDQQRLGVGSDQRVDTTIAY